MCVFCKIAAGEIPAKIAYEDNEILGIYDIQPQAPVHIVFFPKEHTHSCVDDVTEKNCAVIGSIFAAISKTAKLLNLKEGYRIINNCGEGAGQTVPHLHFHLLAGKEGMAESMI